LTRAHEPARPGGSCGSGREGRLLHCPLDRDSFQTCSRTPCKIVPPYMDLHSWLLDCPEMNALRSCLLSDRAFNFSVAHMPRAHGKVMRTASAQSVCRAHGKAMGARIVRVRRAAYEGRRTRVRRTACGVRRAVRGTSRRLRYLSPPPVLDRAGGTGLNARLGTCVQNGQVVSPGGLLPHQQTGVYLGWNS
jgi:hypothetical protein